jgi:hypothetical protein
MSKNANFCSGFIPTNADHVAWLRRFCEDEAVMSEAPWGAKWNFDSTDGDMTFQDLAKASMLRSFFLATLDGNKRKASESDGPAARKPRVEAVIDLTVDDVAFFKDFGSENPRKAVKIGATRLNLLFDAEKGIYSYLLDFDPESLSDELLLALGKDATERTAALDKKIAEWLEDSAAAPLSELPMVMDRRNEGPYMTLFALRFFSKYHKQITDMIEALQGMCEEEEDLQALPDSFTMMLESFCDYIDAEKLDQAFFELVRGMDCGDEDLDENFGDDGLCIDAEDL